MVKSFIGAEWHNLVESATGRYNDELLEGEEVMTEAEMEEILRQKFVR